MDGSCHKTRLPQSLIKKITEREEISLQCQEQVPANIAKGRRGLKKPS